MSISRDKDLRLKLGNLFLAIVFSVVPTSMTIGFLGVHGYILCRSLENRIEDSKKLGVLELCDQSNIEANYSYILWVWLFTTIPTWRWFYISHYRRVTRISDN